MASAKERRTDCRALFVSYLAPYWRELRYISLPTVASTVLLLSSAPRFKKGPVPRILTVTGALSAAYYGRTLYAARQLAH